jgi:hypothetical protein
VEIGERMTSWDGYELPEGTLLQFQYRGSNRIGEIKTDETGKKRFSDINSNAKMTLWTISDWTMYELATESDAALYLLENA